MRRLLASLLSTCAACSFVDAPAPVPTSESAQRIRQGTLDNSDANVVEVRALQAQSMTVCTGSLIAPSLVLTARHCVANVSSNLSCGHSPFSPTVAPSTVSVTTRAAPPSTHEGFVDVASIVTPPEGNDACGYDLALLVLTSPIDSTIASSLVPRVDYAPVAGEAYRAVGYGATNLLSGDAGVRRKRDGLAVACVGAACDAKQQVTATEWVGATSACEGDSGGPALDPLGRVIGVVLRSAADSVSVCDSPVYANIASWGTWLSQNAVAAAMQGHYPPPAWVSSSTGPGPVGGTPSPQGGAAGGPPAIARLGASCTSSLDCSGGATCVASGDTSTCSLRCTPDADDPCAAYGYHCEASQENPSGSYCSPGLARGATPAHGCAFAAQPLRYTPGPGFYSALLAAIFVCRRRKAR